LPKEYICFKCKMQYDIKLKTCLCGWQGTIFRNVSKMPSLVSIKGSVPLDLLNKLPTEKKHKIKDFEILGEVTEQKAIMVWGAPGSRKSTLCLMFMDRIAKTHPRLKHEIFSKEEGFKGTFREKTIRLGISGKNLFVSAPKSFGEIIETIKSKNLYSVCIDSVSSLKLNVDQMKEIADSVSTSLFIYHATKDNSYRGSTAHEHEWDIVVKVDNGIAKTQKNRFFLTSVQLEKMDLNSQIDIDEMQKVYESKKELHCEKVF
jgi:predicted ATP-dependent serine protease